ncbi:type II toxin-antitoxin system prevent-host-death family antitoxin [Nostocoides veronense]|uniref:type II toxin-antitoxin system Phd/YefM family antitoxin n=1 Tax=Nostocoides veronense TaxID=330836 RepID=UPI0031DF8FAF
MSTVGIRALRQDASTVVAQAAAGEVITVTDRGRPVARLGPLPTSRWAALLADGQARLPRVPFEQLAAPQPGPSLTDEILRSRADDRY